MHLKNSLCSRIIDMTWFEDTFKNTQWKKINQMKPLSHCTVKEEVKVISRNFYCCPIFSSSESDLKMWADAPHQPWRVGPPIRHLLSSMGGRRSSAYFFFEKHVLVVHPIEQLFCFLYSAQHGCLSVPSKRNLCCRAGPEVRLYCLPLPCSLLSNITGRFVSSLQSYMI